MRRIADKLFGDAWMPAPAIVWAFAPDRTDEPRWMMAAQRLFPVVRRLTGLAALFFGAAGASAAQVTEPTRFEATPQRPSFSGDAAITAPGTIELELGSATSADFFGLPASLKFTPEVDSGPLHTMEFSVGFDALDSSMSDQQRVTRFGDRVGFAVRRPLYSGDSFSFAVAQQTLFFLREEEGARLGAAALAVYEWGLNSVAANLIWSAATDSSENNPSQIYDIAAGYGRPLGESGTASRFAFFVDSLVSFPSGSQREFALMQGISFRARPDLVFDFAVQQSGLAAGPSDVQFLGGLTVNLGRAGRWVPHRRPRTGVGR